MCLAPLIDFNEYKVINRPKPIANISMNVLRGVALSNRSSLKPSICKIDQAKSGAPALNMKAASTNVIAEITKVNCLEKDLTVFGKNKSTKPTTRGKKTINDRIFMSNLYILQLQRWCANFLFYACRFLTT